MSVRQLTPQEAFERWVAEPTPSALACGTPSNGRASSWNAARRSLLQKLRSRSLRLVKPSYRIGESFYSDEPSQ